MSARRPGNFELSADPAGSGESISIGRMLLPLPAFAAALLDLRNAAADTGLREALVYSLACNAAGLCILNGPQIARALEAWRAARLVMEWRIEFPGTGTLQALFLIESFEPAASAAGEAFQLILRLAGKPSFYLFPASAEEAG